jgi:hypothetical protein
MTQTNASSKSSTKSAAKSKGAAKKPIRKKRGTVLTVILVLIFLHSLFGTYLAYTSLKEPYAGATWIIPVLALVNLASLVSAVGMWFWKKWAIYVYAATCVIGGVVHIVMTGTTMIIFYDLIPFVILGYVLRLQSKRDLFE